MPIRQELLLGASLRPNSRTKMLSDVMFAARGESMAVRSKVEPWSHHDEHSLVTESGSPTGTNTDVTYLCTSRIYSSQKPVGENICECRHYLITEHYMSCFAAISTTFWDQLLPTKASSNDLFAITTPHVDRSLKPSTPSFQSYGVRDTSQGIVHKRVCIMIMIIQR